MEELPVVVGEATTFARKEFDVTDPLCQGFCLLTCPLHWVPVFVPGLIGSKRFILEAEEAVYETHFGGICEVSTRRPYGELGSVDRVNYLCCVGVTSGLTKDQPICPGWGCDSPLVDEIVGDLKARMKQRGDTGNIQRAEATLEGVNALRLEVASLRNDVRLMMEHLGVQPEVMQR